MSLFGELLSTVLERRVRFTAPFETDPRTAEEMAEALVNADGEVSGRSLARQILERFSKMDDSEKVNFFKYLAQALDIDPEKVRDTLASYENDRSKTAYGAFMAAAEPRRQELIRRLNMVEGATGQLVRMRADLLRVAKDEPSLLPLDLDFRHLFRSWFNRGFLVLRPISWESPAHILEKIIAYEAVHAIDSWDELRRRLEPADRRCFAFFHPAMPDEPLVFVEVALSGEVPNSIQDLLAENRAGIDPDNAKTAVFYSISNCQAGLAGISFGNSLIKQVASDLSLEQPNLKTFVTLSPIPGLASWLKRTHPDGDVGNDAWMKMMTAWYLCEGKRPDGAPLDPVARFHLRNGASVLKVQSTADTSDKGERQSHGMMVNYHYDLEKVPLNSETFATTGHVARSADIRSLASAAEKSLAREGNS